MTKHSPSDFGPGEKLQHSRYQFEDVDVKATGKKRLRNLTPFALDRYYRKDLLSKIPADNTKLFDAGNRYRDDFQRAGLQPDVVSRYDEMISNGSVAAFFDGQIDAVNAFRNATAAMDRMARRDVMDCCLFGRAVGKPRMEILREGLWQLVRHYGY